VAAVRLLMMDLVGTHALLSGVHGRRRE